MEVETRNIGVDKNEVIEAMLYDADTFAGVVIPEVHVYQFPPIIISFWEALIANVMDSLEKFPKLAIGIPRGHAKSTIIKLFIVYCILFTRKRFIVVVCASSSLAQNILSDVADMLDSENVISLFGNWRITMDKDTLDVKKFNFRGRDIVLGAIGAEGSFRGLNIKNRRPDVMIFDDAQTKEIAESKATAEKFLSWFSSTALKAKDPAGCSYIYIGNMYKELAIKQDSLGNAVTYGCLLHNLANDPSWKSYISGAILEDGTTLWEELHSIDTLLAELASDRLLGNEDEWFAEVQNDPTYSNQLMFDAAKVKEVPLQDLAAYGANHSAYMILDPSLGKKKSDDQAVATFKVWESTPIMADIKVYKLPIQVLARTLVEYAVENNIPVIFCEDYGMQGVVLTWFDFWIDNLEVDTVEVVGLNRGKLSKNAAIIDYLRSIMGGQQLLAANCRSAVVSQAEQFDPQKTNNVDDILDVGYYGNLAWAQVELREMMRVPLLADFEILDEVKPLPIKSGGSYSLRSYT